MLLIKLFCTTNKDSYIIPVGIARNDCEKRYMIYALGDAFDEAAKNDDIDKCADIARSIGVAEKYIERMRNAHHDSSCSTKLSDFGISYMPIERINKNINQLWSRLYG